MLKPLFTLCENTDKIIASLDTEDNDNLNVLLTLIIIRMKLANSTISTAILFQEEFMIRKEHHRFTDGHVKKVGKKLPDMNIQHFNLRQGFMAAFKVATTTKTLFKLKYSTLEQLKQKFQDVEIFLDNYIELRDKWAEFLMEYRTDINSERMPCIITRN